MARINDIVLIYREEKPLCFARIEDIFPANKKNWYNVKLLILDLPLKTVTWILKEEYIMGEEFTMDGDAMRLELIKSPDNNKIRNIDDNVGKQNKKHKGKIIYLYDETKNKE